MNRRARIGNARRTVGTAAIITALLLSCNLWLAHPALGQTNYTESAAASDLTSAQTCNSISTQASLAPQALVASGAAGGSYTVSVANGSTQEFVLYSASGVPNVTSWPSGNWTVQLNVTTGNSNLTWADACILRVNSSGAAQATVGSLTGQNIPLGSAGVVSMTISGSAQAASSTDRIAVVLNIQSSNQHGTAKSVTLEAGGASDIATSPITPPAPTRSRVVVIARGAERSASPGGEAPRAGAAPGPPRISS
jgi:hypothetical protein